MLEFRVTPGAFKAVQKRVITMSLILFVFVILIVIIIPTMMSDDPARLDTLPIMVPLLVGALAFGTFRGLKRQRSILESFVLKIDDAKIVREQLNTPTITIYRSDVSLITKYSGGSFSIRGRDKLSPIGIPSQIDNCQLLEATLNDIKPMNVLTSKTWLEKLFIPISLSGLVLFGIMTISENEAVSLVCSALLVIGLTACLVVIQRSKNVDKKTRRLSWITLIPILAFLTGIISKLLE